MILKPAPDGCIVWPSPDLSWFPCGGNIDPDALAFHEPVATFRLFKDTGRRFPGVSCAVRFKVCLPRRCGPCCCTTSCGRKGIDIRRRIRYPASSVMSVTSGDGTDLDVSDWEIHENRWLVHAADAWPDDDQIVFAVVYGEDPPIDVLRARDHVLYQMIMSNNPATSFVDGQMTVTENGRTMVINADGKSRLHEAVTKDYKRRSVSSFDDPAEDSVAFIEFV